VLIHVVRRGDTLWKIGQQYNVTVNQLNSVNQLPNPNALVIGQALIIPVPYRDYVVKPGDTLWKIAQQSGTTVQAILQANQIPNPSMIYPGQVIRISDQYRPTIDVNAFTIQFGEEGAQEVRSVSRHLTYVSPFGYRITAAGGLEAINDTATIQAAIANRVQPMMAITNFSATEAGTQLAHTILSNPDLQDRLLTNILTTMRSKGYRGLNVDFENVSPGDRELYNQFLQRTVDRLHPEGFFVSSSLAPKTSGEQKGLLYEAHDYPAHGEILDFVVLMTYEWGYRLGPPQAISPVNQMRAVINYAVSVIPRNKILMGFQLYARDWLIPHVQGQEAETFSMQEAIRRAVRYGAVIQYQQRTESPFFRYTDERGRQHEVWFEDARSAQAKFNLVKEFNLRGISYWVLGYPFPQNWVLLEDNFRVRKS
jgi:spore germination protein